MSSPSMPFAPNDGATRAPDASSDGLRTARGAVADGIDSVATRISTGGGHLADGARAAADKMESSATWLRDTSARDMLNSFEAMVKAHPGRTLLGAVVLGFFAGRAIRGD